MCKLYVHLAPQSGIIGGFEWKRTFLGADSPFSSARPGDMFGVLWCITTGKSGASFNLSTKLTRRAPNPPHLHCIACTFAQFRRIYNKGMTECSIQQGDMIYSRVIQYKVYILSNKIKFQKYFLRNSASSFHWLSSSIFTAR